jgi:dephospho-CoA kinase
MWIIGITGGMGAGKSTLSKYFRLMGIPVHSADHEIHTLLQTDSMIQKKIKTLWPDVFIQGHIDRHLLGKRATSSPHGLETLEKILYPKLAKNQKKFLQDCQKRKVPFVVIDVPLLLEVGLDAYCHFVIVASSPFFLRKQRVFERSGMTSQKFKAFEERQLDDDQRKKRADMVIPCGRDKGSALRQVKRLINWLSQQPSPKWDGKWPTNLKRKPYDSRNCSRY